VRRNTVRRNDDERAEEVSDGHQERLPIERTYLSRAWLAVTGILLVAVVIVTIAVALGRSTAAGGTGLGPVSDYGPVTVQNEPIVVNGSVCGQCR
jgi:hypothetical protein